MRILVIEDEQHLAKLLKRVLLEAGHTADLVPDGRTGLGLAMSDVYNLVILDIRLPGIDGLEICRQMRNLGVQTPVLMLTARGTVDDKVIGLNSGADDYLTKPFAMKEFLARVSALLRRQDRTLQVENELHVGDLTLDTLQRQIKRGSRVIDLTAKEFALLEYLMRHPGQILTRTQIVDHVWCYDAEAISNVVDTYIHYLREKIDQGFSRPLIKTVRGIGYKIEA